MGFKINDTNYNQYKKVYKIIWQHLSTLYDPNIMKVANPLDILDNWEKENKSMAQRGLKEGLRDAISSFKEYPTNLLKTIDADLEKNNLPNVRVLQSIIDDTINKVLRRKKIKTLDEYYTIKEIVIDQISNITEESRYTLDQYIAEFEFPSKVKKS